MLNVLCVKWGDKYDAQYVNKLYDMVSANYAEDFTMHCYTDDATNIDSHIKIIPIPEDNELEIWWNKLCMFKKDFGNIPSGEQILFFDLDLVIQNDIQPILDCQKDGKLTMLKCYWKDRNKMLQTAEGPIRKRDIMVNSSVLVWKANELRNYWNHFEKSQDEHLMKYVGIDRYIHHEGFNYEVFPKGLVYSYREGALFNVDNTTALHRDTFTICIFHQFPKQDEVEDQWVLDYWNAKKRPTLSLKPLFKLFDINLGIDIDTSMLMRCIEQHPDRMEDICRHFSSKQVDSKLWLVEELNKVCNVKDKDIALMGGWYATVISSLLDTNSITSYDVDSGCNIAQGITKKISYKHQDVLLEMNEHDIYINTSCEHMDREKLNETYAKLKGIVVLQSNNYTEVEEHINCVDSADELVEFHLPEECEVLYKGEKQFDKYTRYMVIAKI